MLSLKDYAEDWIKEISSNIDKIIPYSFYVSFAECYFSKFKGEFLISFKKIVVASIAKEFHLEDDFDKKINLMQYFEQEEIKNYSPIIEAKETEGIF